MVFGTTEFLYFELIILHHRCHFLIFSLAIYLPQDYSLTEPAGKVGMVG